MDSVYRRSALTARSAWGAVFEGVVIERKEGEAAVDTAVFKGRCVIVKDIECEGSFEGSSCGVVMLGFFNHTER